MYSFSDATAHLHLKDYNYLIYDSFLNHKYVTLDHKTSHKGKFF